MPNLCGTIIHDAGEQLSKDVEENITWAALSMLGGGLDTVSYYYSADYPAYSGAILFTHSPISYKFLIRMCRWLFHL